MIHYEKPLSVGISVEQNAFHHFLSFVCLLFVFCVCFLFLSFAICFLFAVCFCCLLSVFCLLSVGISIEQNVCHRFPNTNSHACLLLLETRQKNYKSKVVLKYKNFREENNNISFWKMRKGCHFQNPNN